MTLGEAISTGVMGNETLAYFIGRTWLFFQRVGIDPARMRFRQHLQHEVCCQCPVSGFLSACVHKCLNLCICVHTCLNVCIWLWVGAWLGIRMGGGAVVQVVHDLVWLSVVG